MTTPGHRSAILRPVTMPVKLSQDQEQFEGSVEDQHHPDDEIQDLIHR